MASAMRPMLLRQSALSAATRRIAPAPTPSAFLSSNAARVAAFHASGRRSLLPPGPRMFTCPESNAGYAASPHTVFVL